MSKLPLLLAGPMLRQVTPNAVTVWVALLRPATVSLRVFATGAPDTILMSSDTDGNAPRATTAIGKNLHIVAVTVRSQTPLTQNQIYCYDVSFVDAGTTRTLADAATIPGQAAPDKPFAYPPHDFPSFALPPDDLNYLRLVHGSCRKPHGGPMGEDEMPVPDQPAKQYTPTPDQLATLDGLIATDANNAMNRPHQLILTGDQIYADDCDDVLLMALTDAGDTLFGWNPAEQLPAVAPDLPSHAADLPATTRFDIITRAGFTGDDRRNHLIALSEFFAMYLFVWSDVLWYEPLTFAEFALALPASADPGDVVKKGFDGRQAAVAEFRKGVPAVRRALANVPTYMILDDHEVTDDLNMSKRFLNGVYAQPLGVRLMQNALVAFSICQSWGNVPEQFDPASPTAAGTTLLSLLAQVSAAPNNAQTYDALQTQLMELVGVHAQKDLADGTDGSIHVYHDGTASDEIVINQIRVSTKSLRYNFSIEGPAHQVILTDTRTWRGFVPSSEYPLFLYKDQLDDQLNRLVPPLNGRLQLIVFTTNAPPTAGIRLVATSRIDPLFQGGPAKDDLYDSWVFPSRVFDEMLVAVTKRLPVNDGTIAGPVLFLSGDVHFSFSSRLAYWATKRLGDTSTQNAKIVVGQLISSSLKNEAVDTRGMGTVGYGYVPPKLSHMLKAAPFLLALAGAGAGAGFDKVFENSTNKLRDAAIGALAGAVLWLILEDFLLGGPLPPHIPEAYVGWSIATTDPDKKITTQDFPLFATKTNPTFGKNLNRTTFQNGAFVTPDYRYRLDYLSTVRTGQTSLDTTSVGTPSSTDKNAAAQAFSSAAAHRLDLITSGAKLPDCVGNNAIGEITFTWPAGDPAQTQGKIVKHRMHWQSPGADGKAMWADYDVSMDLDDPNYPDLTKAVAP